MISKRFFLAMLAITLVFGMAVIGCDPGGGGKGGNPKPKSITITEIDKDDVLFAMVQIVSPDDGPVALGIGVIIDDTLDVELFDSESIDIEELDFEALEDVEPWTGSGQYLIMIQLFDNNLTLAMYIYTNGKSWDELDINENTSQEDIFSSLPKYNISSANTSIGFDKFIPVPEEWMEDDD